MMRSIAVIPARGGSKRVPGKNIRPFLGKPMIAWTIEAARRSGLFSRIIVSTDDECVAEVAELFGAEVPFFRPEALSNDSAGLTEVMVHATDWILSQGEVVDAVCCMLATAPFIHDNDLKQGLAFLATRQWIYAIGATEFAAPIFRSFHELPAGGVEMFFPEHFLTRSQDLPSAYHDAGQFYWGLPKAWCEGLCGLDRYSTLVKIPRWRVQDIDTEDDWKRAELLAPLIFSEMGVN
jgi:pseudaminic acid cytidylyltransferase